MMLSRTGWGETSLPVAFQTVGGRRAPWGCAAGAPYRGTASPPPSLPPPRSPFAPCTTNPCCARGRRPRFDCNPTCAHPPLRFKRPHCSRRRTLMRTRNGLSLIQWHSPNLSPKLHQAGNCQLTAPHCVIPSRSLTFWPKDLKSPFRPPCSASLSQDSLQLRMPHILQILSLVSASVPQLKKAQGGRGKGKGNPKAGSA